MRAAGVCTLVFPWILVAGCAGTPGGERPEFGESVRHMIEVQTYPAWHEAPGLDGDKAAAAMQRYRRDVSDPGRFGRGLMEID